MINNSTTNSSEKKSSRLQFLKLTALGGATAALAACGTGSERGRTAEGVRHRWSMIIDLQRCVGCGACDIGCKTENNLTDDIFWSHHTTETVGTFPNVRYTYVPTLCNHCNDSPCIRACPTRAMHKASDSNLTLHVPSKCIGCKACSMACPYGVISYNARAPHARYRDQRPAIAGATASGREILAEVGGNGTPYYNKERGETLEAIRPKGVVEKCTMCDHRLAKGKLPACVTACPSSARIFGDANDPASEVSRIKRNFLAHGLKTEMGTNPNVLYVRSFGSERYEKGRGEV